MVIEPEPDAPETARDEPQTPLLWRDFPALSAAALYAALRLRNAVFVGGRQRAYPEIDGFDLEARHLLAGWRPPEDLAGYLRILPPDPFSGAARISRVSVTSVHRGRGVGREMMAAALQEVERLHGPIPVELVSRLGREHFYVQFGFERITEPAPDEQGVEQVRMARLPA